MQEEQPAQARGTTHEDVPDWWPYAAEFPHWHVWQGVSGLLYARRPRTSPPVVVRVEDAVALRNQMRQAEGRMTRVRRHELEPQTRGLRVGRGHG